ncbi:MAG TPA: glycerophosphodiester phosphodiesterase [Rubrivivax sp.]|nr:glycerophosphodiester phosphodiesterase [Rubrivivax sp.]
MKPFPTHTAWALCLALSAPGSAQAFDLQGHRGARGMAPENTLAGFRQALAVGVTTLELDLGVTRDGQVVIAHDPRLNPDLTRDAGGAWITAPGPALQTLTLAELQHFDVGRLKPGTKYAQTFTGQQPADGERVPTLDALFQMLRAAGAPAAVRFNIETKLSPLAPELTPDPETFARLLIEVVQRHGMADRVTVQSFDWRTLRAVQRLAPALPIAALTARLSSIDNLGDPRWTAGLRLQDHGDSVPRLVKALGAGTWSPFHGELTEAQLAEAHALGLKVIPWTVNDPESIDRLIGWGVDGLISDHPLRVREAMARRGMALPASVAIPAPAR